MLLPSGKKDSSISDKFAPQKSSLLEGDVSVGGIDWVGFEKWNSGKES